MSLHQDFEACYRAVDSRDERFDGWFVTAVTTTLVYCRPSCPSRRPNRANVRFFATPAAAQGAGFRACMRCRPDVSPGSPAWNARHDVVGRAMRLIADGVVDREGVSGLAARLGSSERHLHRQLAAEVGAGPLALARSQRAQTARLLIETSDLPLTEVAFAAGFSSIRQFNDTVRAVFGSSPSALRAARRAGGASAPAAAGTISLRLPHRQPLAVGEVLRFLALRAVPGVEGCDAPSSTYGRALALPNGHGVVELRPGAGCIEATLAVQDLRDLGAAVQRCRRLLDLDADPSAVDAQLGADPVLAPLVAARPGIRVPGAVDGTELAVRAVLGQQVSVVGARTLAARLVRRCGAPLAIGGPLADRLGLTHVFPDAGALAELRPEDFAMPRARGASLIGLCRAIVDGKVALGPGEDRAEVEAALLALPGIGAWTASYVVLRLLGDPDVFMPADLGVRHALDRLGLPSKPRAAAGVALPWRPWRSYALVHLWASL